ncbi:uncharacterized protein LOC131940958 isoform X2 [Physella acuta]|uniref:uncharacterized protein LOC131940958 isoform X2 n=1 Tax=Physella acuta TaxID=109671 RepID=UPI0027DAE06F|nr:uncharacterized protein LOC131940958 isoform X2 [Physella acuta]
MYVFRMSKIIWVLVSLGASLVTVHCTQHQTDPKEAESAEITDTEPADILTADEVLILPINPQLVQQDGEEPERPANGRVFAYNSLQAKAIKPSVQGREKPEGTAQGRVFAYNSLQAKGSRSDQDQGQGRVFAYNSLQQKDKSPDGKVFAYKASPAKQANDVKEGQVFAYKASSKKQANDANAGPKLEDRVFAYQASSAKQGSQAERGDHRNSRVFAYQSLQNKGKQLRK